MAIEGPIGELAVSDLLQLLHLSRRSGALTVSGGSLGTTTLFLQQGALVGASSAAPELRLGRLLIGAGRITESQLADALDHQKRRPEERVGQILAEQGAVSASEIESALRFQIDEAVLELMRWQEGYLRFADIEPRSPGRIAVLASTDSVLMEAARRLDELHELVGSPTLDPLPRLTAGKADSGYVHLTPLDWEVLAAIDGKRSLRAISLALGRPQLDVARALYNLTESGVADLGGAGKDLFPAHDVEATLRQIDAAIEESWMDDATALLHQARGVATQLELLLREGRVATMRSEWDAAMNAFAQVSAQAPLRPETHYYRARVLLLQLDVAGAERALKQYMELGDTSERRNLSANRMMESIRELRRTAAESTS